MSAHIFVGANSDIAKVTLKLLDADDDVILITRDISKLSDELRENYDCYNCNPCQLDETSKCFSDISDKYNITNVVNFCGNIMLKPATLLTETDWQTTIAINLTTAFHIAHVTAKYIKHDCGLIFFSTAAAHIGLPNHEAIAAAKAGVEGLAKSFAATYAKQSLRCNVIAPGLIQTKLSQPIIKSDRGKQMSLALHGLNRLGEPNDIARMVLWLLDPNNNWITGEVIRIDGGLSTIKNYSRL